MLDKHPLGGGCPKLDPSTVFTTNIMRIPGHSLGGSVKTFAPNGKRIAVHSLGASVKTFVPDGKRTPVRNEKKISSKAVAFTLALEISTRGIERLT